MFTRRVTSRGRGENRTRSSWLRTSCPSNEHHGQAVHLSSPGWNRTIAFRFRNERSAFEQQGIGAQPRIRTSGHPKMFCAMADRACLLGCHARLPQHQGQAGTEPSRSSRGLKGDGSQLVVEVRLTDLSDQESSVSGADAPILERCLIGHSTEDEEVGLAEPSIGNDTMLGCEVKCGMNGLSRLQTRRKVSAGQDVQSCTGVMVSTLGHFFLLLSGLQRPLNQPPELLSRPIFPVVCR